MRRCPILPLLRGRLRALGLVWQKRWELQGQGLGLTWRPVSKAGKLQLLHTVQEEPLPPAAPAVVAVGCMPSLDLTSPLFLRLPENGLSPTLCRCNTSIPVQ